MQMPAESFFSAGTTACCADLSRPLPPPPVQHSFSAAAAATTHIYTCIRTYVEARIRAARYARSRRRPCGRTPAYLHARYKPLFTGRLSNLDLSFSSIYTRARIILSHIRVHVHARPDSPVIIRTVPRVSPRAARLCIFNASEYTSTPPPTPTPTPRSRGDSGICTGMDAPWSLGPPGPASPDVSDMTRRSCCTGCYE